MVLIVFFYGIIGLMKTTIRMDDITPDMNWERFNRIKDILEAAGIKPLIGVVPYNRDEKLRVDRPEENFAEKLVALERNGWLIALHGYNHVYTSRSKGIFPINEFSEFAGVDYDKQYMMINEGLGMLREWGIHPVIFMAPGHTFDKNTLTALKKNNIYKITDGFGDKPYIRDGITFYPISKRRSDCLSDKEGYNTYVLHTNTMSDKGIDEFEHMLMMHRDKFISYDEYMAVPAVARNKKDVAVEYMMAYAKHLLVSKRASKGTVIHD